MAELKVIAHIFTDFPDKFGVPRQSGLVKEAEGRIVFEPQYRSKDAVKGMEDFSYLWILWQFEGVESDNFKATVRPPRLGGNETMGVFATRSPFRPNPIGLSSVKILKVENTDEGPVIYVSGIDMRNNTPIYDIKPYLSYADSHPDAENGFGGEHFEDNLTVSFPESLLEKIPIEKRNALLETLKEDPRPHYQNDPDRIYGLFYADKNIKFTVSEGVLTVTEVSEAKDYQ